MRSDGDGITYARMGGISYQVADMIAEDCQVESRALVLGHLQREVPHRPSIDGRGLALAAPSSIWLWPGANP